MNSSVLLIRSGLWFEMSGKDVTSRSFSFSACNHCSLSFSVLYRFNCIASFRTQRFWIPLPQNPSFHHSIMFIGIHIWLRTFSLHRSTFIQPWINFSCPFRRPLIFLWHLHVVLWFSIRRVLETIIQKTKIPCSIIEWQSSYERSVILSMLYTGGNMKIHFISYQLAYQLYKKAFRLNIV